MLLETPRLRLRHLTAADAPFTLTLLSEPSYKEFIADRGARTIDDARRYLETSPIAMVARYGFGLNLVESRETGEPMGMCGILKRDTVEDPDLGFAYLPKFWGGGYAREAAEAVLDHARDVLGKTRVLAITTPHNVRSITLLGRLGFVSEGLVQLTPGDPVRLFSRTLARPGT